MELDLKSVELEINYEVDKIIKELNLDKVESEEESEVYKMLIYNAMKKGYILRMEHEQLGSFIDKNICIGDVEL